MDNQVITLYFLFFCVVACILFGILLFIEIQLQRKQIKGLESAIERIKKNKKKIEDKHQELKEKYRKLQTTVKELRQGERK